jgi:hypothetical protein
MRAQRHPGESFRGQVIVTRLCGKRCFTCPPSRCLQRTPDNGTIFSLTEP